MNGIIPFAGRARIWFFVRFLIAALVIFVPLAIAAGIRIGALETDVRATQAERANVKALRLFVDVATSVGGFRDSIISGNPDLNTAARRVDGSLYKARDLEDQEDQATQAAWKKMKVSWWYAKRGRRLEQANHLVDLTNQALTLAMNSTVLPNDRDRAIRTLSAILINDVPLLRSQIHAVGVPLIDTLRRRSMTFRERVTAATVWMQVQTNVAQLEENYGIAGRSSLGLLPATTNNARRMHDAVDPLVGTVRDVVENDHSGESHQAQSSKVANAFSQVDPGLDFISNRTADETDGLLGQRYDAEYRDLLLAGAEFAVAIILCIWLLSFVSSKIGVRAQGIAAQEAADKERAAAEVIRKKTEQALAHTTAFREIVMERAPLGIANIDADGGVFDSNPHLRKFLGDNGADIIGPYRDRFLKFLKSKQPILNFERSFVMKDGRVRWADVTISRLYDDATPLALCMLRDITERKDVELRLSYEATHDGLTKLANRNLFRTELGAMIALSQDTADTFAVLFIDLDLFKYVNDTYGHAAGDFVLITVSSRLLSLVRSGDLVARFGGDEFAILLGAPATLGDAERISQSIVASLAEPILWGEQIVNIGSSIGLALGPAGAENAEEIMRNSDTAMYAAKQLGRGRYVIFDPAMQEAAHQSAQLANDLQTALQDQSQIHLLYQPIVGLEQNEIIGFEALARWNHPVFGEIPRDDFVKVAEKSGAIRNLGRYVLRAACLQLMALGERVPMAARLSLSVNISPSELAMPNFVESMVDVIRETDFDPRRLYLEITENIMIVRGDQANRIMSRLREFGIRISIDDFGAGYSSLRYLQELHIDLLKVDRGFLRSGPDGESGRTILRAIVNLASGFDLPVVAEGVETAEHLQLIRSIGCQYAQGDLWGKPMSITDIESRLTGKPSKAGS